MTCVLLTGPSRPDDIDSARRRTKRASVLAKLRAGLGARRVIRPAYGELCFFEHEFKSPAGG